MLRADSGFARDALMSWYEQTHIDFVFGLAKNDRLKAQIETKMNQAQALYLRRQCGNGTACRRKRLTRHSVPTSPEEAVICLNAAY